MSQHFAILSFNIDSTSKTKAAFDKRADKLRRDRKLVAELESYLNRKLKKHGFTVSRLEVGETEIL